MSSVARVPRRFLPRDGKDFGCQVVIWFAFLAVYELARGLAGHDVLLARAHGWSIIDFERRTGDLFELTLQSIVLSSHWLAVAVAWTYWLSEFAVLGLALLWVYLRRNAQFRAFRNWVYLTGLVGFVGYVFYPTAPPRMFPTVGFVDLLARFASLNHGSGAIQISSNPYAAMPSLHSADALIVGITLARLVRRRWMKLLWLLWPCWVWFSVMASANHFWLDCVAGVLVALTAGAVIHRRSVIPTTAWLNRYASVPSREQRRAPDQLRAGQSERRH